MKPVVAIVGRPNVGKSTLFNRIVGRREAITLDVSGVTRDRHYSTTVWEGREFLCVDTGGLILDGKGTLEKKVREQVEVAIQEATVILFVMDARAGLNPEEKEISRIFRRSGKKVLYVLNKVDGLRQEAETSEFYLLSRDLHPVSAEHGYRVNDLLDVVVQNLPHGTEKTSQEKGIRIAIIGRPNVGKSSLVNRFLGEERAVVHEEPGTTRDVVDTHLKIGSKDYLLLDTAGIRRKGKWASKVERYSVLSALKAIERSDICLLLLDASEGIHKQDAHVAGYAAEAGKGILIVWNKWDLVRKTRKETQRFAEEVRYHLPFLSYASILFISASTGEGCAAIWKSVDGLYASCGRRIPTARVNEAFESLISSHNPPVYKGRPVKFFYATQTNVFPPAFVVFTNEPAGVHFSFRRYLVNGFRKTFRFEGAPLRLFLRKKN